MSNADNKKSPRMDTKSISELNSNVVINWERVSSKSWIAQEIKKFASVEKVFFRFRGKEFILQQTTTRGKNIRDLGEGKTEQIEKCILL